MTDHAIASRRSLLALGGLAAVSLPLATSLAPAHAAGPFVDVPTGSILFSDDINWMYSSGISTGWMSGGKRYYKPFENVERGAMAAFFYRLAGSPKFTVSTDNKFVDVPKSHQFFKEIDWMWRTGISTGWNDGTFRPESPVNRDAMAAFMYRLAGSPNITPHQYFVDVTPGMAFYKEISWMWTRYISNGWDDGTYRPLAPVKRDAMAAFIHRFHNQGLHKNPPKIGTGLQTSVIRNPQQPPAVNVSPGIPKPTDPTKPKTPSNNEWGYTPVFTDDPDPKNHEWRDKGCLVIGDHKSGNC